MLCHYWIADQVRNDKLGVRNDKLEARNDKSEASNDKLEARNGNAVSALVGRCHDLWKHQK